MLDIWDMSEKDNLFLFVKKLKPWAQIELNRRGVCDLMAVIIEAEWMMNFNTHEGKKQDQNKKSGQSTNSNASHVSNNEFFKGKTHHTQKKQTPKESSSKGTSSSTQKPKHGCFLCDGPHKVTDCPIKGLINAIIAKGAEQKAKGKKVIEAEDEPRMGTLTRLNVVCKQMTRNTPQSKGFIYIKVKINGVQTRAMIGTGVIHNFMFVCEATKLCDGEGLKPHKGY